MEKNRELELKQAERLRKFIRKIEWKIQEIQFDSFGFVMSSRELNLMLKRNEVAKRLWDRLHSMKFRAKILLWKVA